MTTTNITKRITVRQLNLAQIGVNRC